MYISSILFENNLIDQISPIDQEIVSLCSKQFNQVINKYKIIRQELFRTLNPYLHKINLFDATLQMKLNAYMIQQLTSRLKQEDESIFGEFLINSQECLLIKKFEVRQYELCEEENNDNFAQSQELIQYLNEKFTNNKKTLKITNKKQIGQFDRSNTDIILDDYDNKKLFKKFLKQFCKLKIIKQWVNIQIKRIMEIEQISDGNYNLNIVKITQKYLLKSNIKSNIELAKNISRRFQKSDFDIYSSKFENIIYLRQYSEIQQDLYFKYDLLIEDYLEYLDIKTKIPVLLQIQYENTLDYIPESHIFEEDYKTNLLMSQFVIELELYYDQKKDNDQQFYYDEIFKLSNEFEAFESLVRQILQEIEFIGLNIEFIKQFKNLMYDQSNKYKNDKMAMEMQSQEIKSYEKQ